MPGKGKPFIKGKDPRRNTDGAPKKEWTWAGVIKRIAEEEQAGGTELKELVGKSLIKECLKGNVVAIKEFGDRIDGKPMQKTETDLTSGGEKIEGIDFHFIHETKSEPPPSV